MTHINKPERATQNRVIDLYLLNRHFLIIWVMAILAI
jgi:hypothetical protein